ncbi:MAG: hypothetical protein AB1847_03695 [bacterium]
MGKKTILFRCDGSREIGFGSVVRCLALADELSQVHHVPSAFAMRESPLAFDMVRQKGYPVLATPQQADDEAFDYIRWLDGSISQVGAGALILDVRDDLQRDAVDTWRRQGVLVVALDDPSERRLAADLAFYPPVPQVQNLDWSGFSGQLYTGWEWVVLRRELSHRPQPRSFHESSPVREHPRRPVVLVTMGGSDPEGLTLKAVAALDLLYEDFETVLVLGPAFPHNEELKSLLAAARRSYTVKSCVTDMPALMAHSSLAVTSFGVTAYELAALGIPAIYVCLTQDHFASSTCLVDAGMGKSLGVFSQVSEEMLADAVRELLARIADGEKMIRRPVDGRGAERIALLVAERMRSGEL